MSIKHVLSSEMVCISCGFKFRMMLSENGHISQFNKDNVYYCKYGGLVISCVNCQSTKVKLYLNGPIKKSVHDIQRAAKD